LISRSIETKVSIRNVEIINTIDKDLDQLWEKALNAPYPPKKLLKEIVYK